MSAPEIFMDRKLVAERTARMLLEVKAVHFSAENPFIFTSGWASPVYIDCRKLISFPRLRNAIIDFAVALVQREIGYESLEGIAGGETAGIPFATLLADRLMLPMQYVRKKPKGFGRNAQIEGDLKEGSRILLVEDLTTDARSKINFCKALRQAGAQVDHAFVIFHYAIFPQSTENMRAMGVNLHSLATWWDVLEVAKTSRYFETSTLSEVEAFLHEPEKWSAAHGGISTFPSQ